MRAPFTAKRAGFTLIEMLVVIIIIIVLATIAVAITPRIAGEQKVGKGADQVQGWLLIAKSRAKRDQIPTGVRLVRTTLNTSDPEYWRIRELQYVQQPDDFVGGQVQLNVRIDPVTKKVTRIYVDGAPTTVDFTGGFGNATIYPVQVGDYFEIKGGGMVHRITGINSPTQLELEIKDPGPHPTQTFTQDYRIIRKPRVLIGETPMLLAQDIVIDVATNDKTYGTNPPVKLPPLNNDGSIDIMFSPSGSMMSFGGSSGSFLPLWIRDVTADAPTGFTAEFGGNPIIVCIMKRAGFIAAHPVDMNPSNPYSFANDGKSSGL